MASAEGKRTERFSEKSLNLESSLNLRFGFPRLKRHFSHEGNEQFLTASPGSVLFSRSTLLKRKDLCFSCLRLGLIRHRRSNRASHLSSQSTCHDFLVVIIRARPPAPWCAPCGVVSLCVSIHRFSKCPWSIIDLFRILRIFYCAIFSQLHSRIASFNSF